ncbi:MAG: hypothetical protein WDM84_09010 [Bauldia sp.]
MVTFRGLTGGLIVGGDFGISLGDIQNGNVVLDNTHGTVYGDEMAFAPGGDGTESGQGLTNGNVYIMNSHGMMEGKSGTNPAFGPTNISGHDSLGAITINDVQSEGESGGHVFIYNEAYNIFGGRYARGGGGTIGRRRRARRPSPSVPI